MSKELTLTKSELSRRTELEKILTETKAAFFEHGQALTEMRDSRLYRSTHNTFDAYCSEVWGYKRAHAYRLIAAAGIAKDPVLSPIGDKIKNEHQARKVLKVAKEAKIETPAEVETVVQQVVENILTDELGARVPDSLSDDWWESKSVGTRIKEAGKEFKYVVDGYLNEGDKFKQKHNLSDQMSKDIGELIHEMSRTIPYAVCPSCKGERCRNCHSRGWVSKIYYKQFVPKNLKT